MKHMKTTKTALIYRLNDNAWRCETQGTGHHAGGDTRHFRTLQQALSYARLGGYTPKRAYNCDQN